MKCLSFKHSRSETNILSLSDTRARIDPKMLNNARDVYTKDYYFSIPKLFSTISLLQKQRLNDRNYSKQALNMDLFV
jgi:hypothetical protein